VNTTSTYPLPCCRLAKRRFYVAEDGRIMRRHTHNRHNKSKRSKSALRRLKGDTPLAKGNARKLHKLGFKRKSWYHVKKG
jgi:ribosomal protein L35